MPPRRHPASWTLLFAGCVLLAAGLAAGGGPPTKEYQGTIYYADYHGVWKVQLPSLQKTRLASQELVDPFYMELSPDEQWLAYTDTRDHFQTDQPPVLWVLSRQGGYARQGRGRCLDWHLLAGEQPVAVSGSG